MHLNAPSRGRPQTHAHTEPSPRTFSGNLFAKPDNHARSQSDIHSDPQASEICAAAHVIGFLYFGPTVAHRSPLAPHAPRCTPRRLLCVELFAWLKDTWEGRMWNVECKCGSCGIGIACGVRSVGTVFAVGAWVCRCVGVYRYLGIVAVIKIFAKLLERWRPKTQRHYHFGTSSLLEPLRVFQRSW